MRAIFAGSVFKLHHHGLLDTSIIHGDKIVAFCDRNCNVIAPFVTAPGNKNESPLFREVLPGVMRTARAIGIDLQGTVPLPVRRKAKTGFSNACVVKRSITLAKRTVFTIMRYNHHRLL